MRPTIREGSIVLDCVTEEQKNIKKAIVIDMVETGKWNSMTDRFYDLAAKEYRLPYTHKKDRRRKENRGGRK